MYQQQVNNNNNNISSTLDCCESRTVRTISTKHLQQQQPTVKVPPLTGTSVPNGVAPLVSALDFITENTITCKKSATKVALTTEMQSVCQARSLRRKPLMKTYALLPIICIIICAQISTTSGRTLLGRKQFLHSLQNRMQHHKNLMRYEREYAPKHIVQMHPRHHRIVRSNDRTKCPEYFELSLKNLKNQSNASRQTLMRSIDSFTKARFSNLTAIEVDTAWSKHNLSLKHPYADWVHRTIDTKGYRYNFPDLDGQTLSEELLGAEMEKIFTTLKSLKIVYNEVVTDNNKSDWIDKYKNDYLDMINFLKSTYAELTKTENVVIGIMNSIHVPKSIITTAKYNNETSQVREWLLVVESVSFLEYLAQLSQKLLEMCK